MCGVFGVRAPERDVARLTYFGLFALQHRGQESAGIAVSENGRLTALRDLGLVPQVFDERNLSGLRGELAIGHTRYSTTGSNAWANAQPLLHHGSARTVALGHNGNLVNAAELRAEGGKRLASTTDSEMIAALIADDPRPLGEAIAGAMARLEGAATVVGIADGQLFAFRDRHGFRPLVLGRLGDDTVVASESCALDMLGAEPDREVRPGELVLIGEDGVETIQAEEPASRGSLCIFEFFYLARPDTRLAGVEMHGARVRMGERLAVEAPVEADLVLPVPDSGTPAAIGFARATGIPFSEGLIKNRYVGRTFIQPEQGMREQGIRMKFNPLAEVEGKRLVVIDDSIVRGLDDQADRRDAVRRGCRRGARPDLLPADRVTVLLRHRFRIGRRADRLALDGRGSAQHDRRDEPRLSVTRRAAGSDAQTRERPLPRLPHARLSDARSGRNGEAPFRGVADLLSSSARPYRTARLTCRGSNPCSSSCCRVSPSAAIFRKSHASAASVTAEPSAIITIPPRFWSCTGVRPHSGA